MRPVNQVQIQIICPEHFQRTRKGIQRALIALMRVPQLAGQENVFSRNAGFCDCLADTSLVAVGRRGVNVAVADAQRLCYGLLRLFIWCLPCAEAQLQLQLWQQ